MRCAPWEVSLHLLGRAKEQLSGWAMVPVQHVRGVDAAIFVSCLAQCASGRAWTEALQARRKLSKTFKDCCASVDGSAAQLVVRAECPWSLDLGLGLATGLGSLGGWAAQASDLSGQVDGDTLAWNTALPHMPWEQGLCALQQRLCGEAGSNVRRGIITYIRIYEYTVT